MNFSKSENFKFVARIYEQENSAEISINSG